MIEKLNYIVNEQIKGQLNQHGGDMQISEIKDGIVRIKLLGNCSNCPGIRLTFEDIIKTTILKEVPEVKDVVLDDGLSDDILNFAKSILNKVD